MLEVNVPAILNYTPGILDTLIVPQFSSESLALEYFIKNKVLFTCNILSCFEGVRVSLADTETILNGYSVCTAMLKDLLKINFFGQAITELYNKINKNLFLNDRCDLIDLHNIIDPYASESRGIYLFRSINVKLKNVTYTPPKAQYLRYYWQQIYSRIIDKKRIFENALVIFLQLARMQYFSDANKRTALLFINGILLKNCLYPVIIPGTLRNDFGQLLAKFYEDGEADDLLQFFARTSVADSENCAEWLETCSAINYRNLSFGQRHKFIFE